MICVHLRDGIIELSGLLKFMPSLLYYTSLFNCLPYRQYVMFPDQACD